MNDAALMQYFKFDDADLGANRLGQFSAQQAARLEAENKGLGALVHAISHRAPVLAKAEGRAEIPDVAHTFSDHRVMLHPELHVGGKRFRVTAALRELLEGRGCCVYFIDRALEHPADQSYLYASEDILSVELTEGAGAPAPAAAEQPVDAELLALVRKGDTLAAIRRHRALYASSLEAARAEVERIKAEAG